VVVADVSGETTRGDGLAVRHPVVRPLAELLDGARHGRGDAVRRVRVVATLALVLLAELRILFKSPVKKQRVVAQVPVAFGAVVVLRVPLEDAVPVRVRYRVIGHDSSGMYRAHVHIDQPQ
jgi:hypothetical protein